MAAVGVGALISGIRLAIRKSVVGLDNIIGGSAALFGTAMIVARALKGSQISMRKLRG